MSAVERTFRRILSGLGLARITATEDGGPTQVCQVDFGAGEVHDRRYRLAEYGFASRPKAGADAVVVFPAGDRSAGVVIATGDRRFRLHLEEGEVALHDDLGHVIKLARDGIKIDGGGHNLAIVNVPVLTTAGSIEAAGDITAGTVSLQNHAHTGSQPGSGHTGPPEP